MNLTLSCKSIKILILFLVTLVTLPDLHAEFLRPVRGGETKEILVIAGKRRVYYPIQEHPVIYQIKGPMRLEFISRYPVPRRTSESIPFSYRIMVEEKDTIEVNHRYLVSRSIRSVQHPNYYFTYSGNYFINLPAGEHKIRVEPLDNNARPVMVRLLGEAFDDPDQEKRNLSPAIHQEPTRVLVGTTALDYYELKPDIPLQISAEGPGILKIISRLEFEAWMGEEEIYRLQVTEGRKVIGTFYFSTEPSSKSIIQERSDRLPAKWRTCKIDIPEGLHTYDIQVLENDRTVLLRFEEYR